MIRCISEITERRKEDGLERMQEGGGESIWRLFRLHSFIHSNPAHGRSHSATVLSAAGKPM